jgi:hypothetical protein
LTGPPCPSSFATAFQVPKLPPINCALACGGCGPLSVNTEITPPDALPYSEENGPRSTSIRCAETRLKLPVWPWPSGIVAGMLSW